MKSIILAVLFTLCLFHSGSAVTGYLGTPTAFSYTDTFINIEDGNNNTVLTFSFGVTRGCKTSTCYLNVGLLSTVSRPTNTNLPSTSSILYLGAALQQAQAINVTITPLSALLNGTVITFSQLVATNQSYSGFIFDRVYGQFGLMQTVGNSIAVQSDYLVPSIFLFATIASTDAIPLINSQYVNLVGSTPSNLALGNGLYLNVTSTYDNSLRVFYTTSNPTQWGAPSGYAPLNSWYQIQLRNPEGSISGNWNITSSSSSTTVLNSTALAFASPTATAYSIPVYSNTTRYFVTGNNTINSVYQGYNQLLGTWGLYTQSGVAAVVPSIVLVLFAVMMIVS